MMMPRTKTVRLQKTTKFLGAATTLYEDKGVSANQIGYEAVQRGLFFWWQGMPHRQVRSGDRFQVIQDE